MSAKLRLVKLVRDNVGDNLPVDDSHAYYMPMDDQDFLPELRKKLAEEAIEYLINPSVGELADIYEVLAALAHYDQGLDMRTVSEEARAKREERGGFDAAMGMFVNTTATPRHEGDKA